MDLIKKKKRSKLAVLLVEFVAGMMCQNIKKKHCSSENPAPMTTLVLGQVVGDIFRKRYGGYMYVHAARFRLSSSLSFFPSSSTVKI